MNVHPDLDPDPPMDPEGTVIARLLAERADTIRPRGTSPSQLVRRAERARRRRRSAAVGTGLAVTSAVAAVAVATRPVRDDPRIDAAADPAVTSPAVPPTDGARPLVDPNAPNVFVPAEVPVVEPATQPPLRLGLDVAGWTATSVGDFESGDADPGRMPPMTRIALVDAAGATRISVFVIFPDPSAAPVMDGNSVGSAPETVDLGDGRTAQRMRWPASPTANQPPPVYLQLDVSGASVSVTGTGASDAELIGVARAVEISAGPAVRLGWIPADLAPQLRRRRTRRPSPARGFAPR